jgi:hypothetical protein
VNDDEGCGKYCKRMDEECVNECPAWSSEKEADDEGRISCISFSEICSERTNTTTSILFIYLFIYFILFYIFYLLVL